MLGKTLEANWSFSPAQYHADMDSEFSLACTLLPELFLSIVSPYCVLHLPSNSQVGQQALLVCWGCDKRIPRRGSSTRHCLLHQSRIRALRCPLRPLSLSFPIWHSQGHLSVPTPPLLIRTPVMCSHSDKRSFPNVVTF